MCNDDISNYNTKIGGLGYLTLAKPLAACTYLSSIDNSFRVIRCLSQCVDLVQKSLFLPHFGFPSGPKIVFFDTECAVGIDKCV